MGAAVGPGKCRGIIGMKQANGSSLLCCEAVSLEQLSALQRIAQQTFIETFADSNSASDMADYVAQRLSAEQLLRELQTVGSHFYLALWEDQVAGYLKLNTGAAQTHPESPEALEIERIYVLQSFQGQKIGRFLLEKAFNEARLLQAPYVWLGVWEENQKAIRFYQQHGFERYDTHVFQLGNDAQTDWLMRLSHPY
jgi:diamine N-acetyltransferase